MGLTLLKVEVNTLDVLGWTLFYLHSALSGLYHSALSEQVFAMSFVEKYYVNRKD